MRGERERERVNGLRGGGANVLVDFAGARNHDERDLGVAEDGELVGLLEESVPSLGVGHLPVGRVLYPPDLDLPPRHLSLSLLLLSLSSNLI